jgi:hypothetical protein
LVKKLHGLEAWSKENDRLKWKEDKFEIKMTGRKVWRKRQLIWHDEYNNIDYKKWQKRQFLFTWKDHPAVGDAIQ